MLSRPLPEDLRVRFEFLEACVAARQLISDGVPAAEVADACGVSVDQLLAIPADGCLPVDFIAETLGVSHQYISKLSDDAFDRIRRFHPGLRQALRAA